MRKYQHTAALALALLMGLACFAPSFSAQTSGQEQLVYVAGNPDLFPIEYYDQKEKQFAGVIPSLLEQLSSGGNYRFVYLHPEKTDRRKELAKNLQAELISGCSSSEEFGQEMWDSGVVVLSAQKDGARQEYRLLFTSIASEELRQAVETGIKSMDSALISTLLIEHAAKEKSQIKFYLLIGLTCAVILLTATVVFLLLHYRKKLGRGRRELETDMVTELGNYDYLKRYYRQLINDHNRILYSLIYFRIDTERLRRFADTEQTDHVLKYTAIVLKEYTADTDILARIADNGFVLLKLSSNEEEIKNWLTPVLRRIREYPEKYDKSFFVDIHVGIYRLRASDRDMEEMVFNATQSCNYAIMNRLDYAVCSDEIIQLYREEAELQEHARVAFEKEEIKLYLHFFVQCSTRRIVGAEGLSRWIHPDKGLMMPARFIPLMEREGTIQKLDYYILDKVCRFLEKLHANGIKDFFISCNLSRKTFMDVDFEEKIAAVLQKYDFPHESLILELTESEVSKSIDILSNNILSIKKQGVRIAIDDFGSGYSSFEDLQKYPIDGLKLDKSLVDNVNSDEGYAILKGLVEIGHSLGMTVLAEGAENEQQVNALTGMNCDVIQGFYFYQPLPQDEALRLYLENGH